MGFDEGNRAIPPARARTHCAPRHRCRTGLCGGACVRGRDAQLAVLFSACCSPSYAGRARTSWSRAKSSTRYRQHSLKPAPPRIAPPYPAPALPRPATPPALCCEVSLLADAVCARRRCGVGAAATSRSARRRCAVHRRALPRLMRGLTLRDDSKRWWNGAARALCSKCQRSGEGCADAAAAAPVQSRVLHRAELQRVQRAHASARQPARALAVSMQHPSGHFTRNACADTRAEPTAAGVRATRFYSCRCRAALRPTRVLTARPLRPCVFCSRHRPPARPSMVL